MTQETPEIEHPKIINLFGGAYEPEKRGDKVSSAEPDEPTVKALEELLERAKKGEITGCLFLTWCPEAREFNRQIVIPSVEGLEMRNAAAMSLGALKMLMTDVEDIAFWTQGYEPMCIVPSENLDEDDLMGDEE